MNGKAFSLIQKALSFFQRRENERGQIVPLVALGMVGLLGVAGLTIDAGSAYVASNQLQNTTNAAALAGAAYIYNSSSTGQTAATQAAAYGSQTGGLNPVGRLQNVQQTVTTKCLNVLAPKGFTCLTLGGTPNAVQVKQTASVPTYFVRLFGMSSINLAATATAAMQGVAHPWNVAIIVDSTGSMDTKDANCGGVTEFQCALDGVQGLLAATNPCPWGVANCTDSQAVFHASLFTFPNISTDTVQEDIGCGGNPGSIGHPTAEPYSFPLSSATAYTPLTYTPTAGSAKGALPWTATYQIVPFTSNYYQAANKVTGGLNPDSDLVKAVGYGGPAGHLGCLTYTDGIKNSGFGNTSYASVIYAAQSSLLAEQLANPGSRNAIIFLSDGQANADKTQFPSAVSGSKVGPAAITSYQTPSAIAADVKYSVLGVNGKGLYPDWNDQCQQGIMAAQYASTYPNNNTTVYSVAYGSEASGCNNSTDNSLVATGVYNNPFTLKQLLPCTTMENIASSWGTFYSDNEQTGSNNLGCVDNSHSTISLQNIFAAIAASFTTPQLVPNNAT